MSLAAYMDDLGRAARAAATQMAAASTAAKNTALLSLARRLREAGPALADLIAGNVVDFGCWLYGRDAGGGLVRVYPAGEGDLADGVGERASLLHRLLERLRRHGHRRPAPHLRQ